jgi:hypothetical protein
MKRTYLFLAAAAGFLFAVSARADDASTDPDTQADSVLAEKAEIPAKPPTLPSQASDRATFVHENIAFGKKGEAERLAHSQADKQGKSDADDAHADDANRAAQGAAASAAGSANADSHAAAGQARAGQQRPTTTGRR